MAADDIAIHVIIRGRVQGVWFRAWTVQTAQELGIDGWVRNRRDGSVEALFAGPYDAVTTMLTQCAKGPPAARVERIERKPGYPPGEPGFLQLPTE